ncbi:MAG: protein-glutamate O-methyltransferase CheR [Betaproteobacteria bacterium]|nr:protein-glutamate O-methyltransferase CheR [Betaproteobacteria bacterium]
MTDPECIHFLQWALPRLNLRWHGFRKVRNQVCRRVNRRMRELGLSRISDYRTRLEREAVEWSALEAMCPITISRFYRDRRVFEVLAGEVLPELATLAIVRGESALRAWSAGCASGEEAYTLKILWDMRIKPQFRGLDLRIIGTDVEPAVLERARAGLYRAGSVKELPSELLQGAFAPMGGAYRVRDEHRANVAYERQDIRIAMPGGRFDLILCRNLVLTYFARSLQEEIVERIAGKLHPGGALVAGIREALPGPVAGLQAWHVRFRIYRKERVER